MFTDESHLFFFIVGLAIAAYGAYVFISRDYPTYLFLPASFVFLDYDEAKITTISDHLSLMGMFIFYLALSVQRSEKARWQPNGKRRRRVKRVLSFLLCIALS